MECNYALKAHMEMEMCACYGIMFYCDAMLGYLEHL